MPDDLSRDALASALKGRFGSPVRTFDVIGSTNEEALTWAAAGAPDGALVVAGHQTGGRGRRGRGWYSQPGAGLAFSVVIRPPTSGERLGLLTTAAGVGCAEGIESVVDVEVGLKWPNDLIVRDRKIGGILTETSLRDEVAIVVIGVGINRALSLKALPSDLADRATDLARASGTPAADLPSHLEILAALLERLEASCDLVWADPASVVEAATRRSTVLGRDIRIESPQGPVEGRAVRLLASGALEVDLGGSMQVFTSGEVERIR